MNWNEKAKGEADRLHEAGLNVSGFEAGAKWQRNQLRTDEANKRVAREVWAESYAREKGHFEDEWKSTRNYYKVRAERLITALLGEEPCHR